MVNVPGAIRNMNVRFIISNHPYRSSLLILTRSPAMVKRLHYAFVSRPIEKKLAITQIITVAAVK